MRTLLICHDDAPLDREGLVRWLGSFSTFTGTVAIREPARRLRRRLRREISRVGFWRFADVLAYRAYHQLRYAAVDRLWERRQLEVLRTSFAAHSSSPEIIVASPNSAEAEAFIRGQQPDLVIARCKTLLKRPIFAIPPLGTYVMHPGICPEYRNAHGCFWAVAGGDHDNVGMTLLRIDEGIDTGPVYGYFRIKPNPTESHVIVQHRTVHDHLEGIRDRLLEIAAGRAKPIPTDGRRSATWGQPWLSAYLKSRRRRRRTPDGAALLTMTD